MQENAARRSSSNWADHNIALRFNWRRSHWGGGFTIWACIDAPRPTSTELCEYIRLQITLRCIALQFACLTPPQLCKVTMGNPSLGEPPPITMGCDFQWEKHVEGTWETGRCLRGWTPMSRRWQTVPGSVSTLCTPPCSNSCVKQWGGVIAAGGMPARPSQFNAWMQGKRSCTEPRILEPGCYLLNCTPAANYMKCCHKQCTSYQCNVTMCCSLDGMLEKEGEGECKLDGWQGKAWLPSSCNVIYWIFMTTWQRLYIYAIQFNGKSEERVSFFLGECKPDGRWLTSCQWQGPHLTSFTTWLGRTCNELTWADLTTYLVHVCKHCMHIVCIALHTVSALSLATCRSSKLTFHLRMPIFSLHSVIKGQRVAT